MFILTIPRTTFGEEFAMDPNEDEETAVVRFLSSYVQVCCRLVQVDADRLQQNSIDNNTLPHLSCSKALKALSTILRFSYEVPIWNLLRRLYHSDVEAVWLAIMHAFSVPSANGMRHLTRLSDAAAKRMGQFPALNMLILQCLRIAEQASSLITRSYSRVSTSGSLSPLWFRLRREALLLFQTIQRDLEESASIQTSSVSLEFSRELVLLPGSLLSSVSQIPDDTTVELANEFLESVEGIDIDIYPALISNSWKFQLLKRYISKGRMELRVFGIETMNNELVNAWKHYNTSPAGHAHPVMQYLAQFLLNEKVIDYIISADSHPQLISRSGNIVGFLIVTHRYTQKETDTIWSTVSRSQDPRVVAATLSMLSSIVNLMQMPELLYFCQKLSQLPVDAFDIEVLRFMREVLERISYKPQDWSRSESKMSPFKLCLRLVGETSPTEMPTGGMSLVYAESSRELIHLARFAANSTDRMEVYQICANSMGISAECGASSMHAMYLILKSNPVQDDLDTLIEEFSLTKLAVEEFCSFVRASQMEATSLASSTALGAALNSRLDILFYLIHHRPRSLPTESEHALWDHLVAQSALGTAARNSAWGRLAELAKEQHSEHPFLNRCIHRYFAELKPDFITSGSLDFAHESAEYELRVRTSTNFSEGQTLNVPGADMLWRIVLCAAGDTVEQAAARLLASLYTESSLIKRAPLSCIEATHVAIVDTSMKNLIATPAHPVADPQEKSCGGPQSIGIHNDALLTEEYQLRSIRTLMFLGVLVQLVRLKPELISSIKEDLDSKLAEPISIKGDSITIYYQAFNGVQTDMRTLRLGDLETIADLRGRLVHLTGFTNFMVISGGQVVDLSQSLHETIRESAVGKKGALLLKKVSGSQLEEREPHLRCSAIEREILRYFDQLYRLMVSEDDLSRAVRP